MALVAAHLGVVDEAQIDNMSYIFFNAVLAELGHKLQYEAVVNYAGNSFCKDSWDMILDAHPMMAAGEHRKNKTMNTMADFFSRNATVLPAGGKLPGKGFNGRNKRGK